MTDQNIIDAHFEPVDDESGALSPTAWGNLGGATHGFREEVAALLGIGPLDAQKRIDQVKAQLGLKSARGSNKKKIIDALTMGKDGGSEKKTTGSSWVPGNPTHGLLMGAEDSHVLVIDLSEPSPLHICYLIDRLENKDSIQTVADYVNRFAGAGKGVSR